MSGSKKLVAHTLVRNEARWIWFAINSVLDLVDEILVWDTGSTDSTAQIVQSLPSPKIKFKSIGQVDAPGHTAARQAMLEATDSDWILILDGDEIWYQDSLVSCIDASTHDTHLAAIISPFVNLMGDVYHFQSPHRSQYQIGGYRGAFNIRFINRHIPGLHVANPHGRQEYQNQAGVSIQNFSSDQLRLVNKPYLHTTHLLRSDNRDLDQQTLKRNFKFRYELGSNFPRDFVYPEVFYLPRPKIVPDPWIHRSGEYVFRSLVYEPARWAKSLFAKESRSGY
jgi:glycosyltransferase involved in cell wall biosynthesis